MARLKLKIHPLFFVFGLYYALTGNFFLFLIFTITALIHESGHSFVAGKLGYRLNAINLMPYGAVINGNVEGLKAIDEIKVALAGPLINLFIGILFIATWWIYPESYAYTDTIVSANLSLALINVIPAYPLDGGRVMSALLKLKTGEKAAYIIIKVVGVIIAAALIVLFIISCFNTLNISLLFFALFILAGVLSREKEIRYVKTFSFFSASSLKRGLNVNRIAVSDEITIKKLINLLEPSSLNEVEVFSGETKVKTVYQNELSKIIEENSVYTKLKDCK